MRRMYRWGVALCALAAAGCGGDRAFFDSDARHVTPSSQHLPPPEAHQPTNLRDLQVAEARLHAASARDRTLLAGLIPETWVAALPEPVSSIAVTDSGRFIVLSHTTEAMELRPGGEVRRLHPLGGRFGRAGR